MGDCAGHKRHVMALPKPKEAALVLELSVPYFHRPCEHNEYVSLCNRVLSPPFKPSKWGREWIQLATLYLCRWAESNQVACLSRQTFLASVKIPGKKKVYERAVAELEKGGFQDFMGILSAFIKVEPIDGYAKGSTDPRMIQARSAEFNVEFGRYFKPIEHLVLSLDWSEIFSWAPRGRLIAKGLNNVQRGRLIAHKFRRFRKPVVIGIDASRFDQSVSRQFLKMCHAFYLALHNGDPYLAKLLLHQLVNRGKTKSGIKYQADGGRASGDMDTGGGNSIITVVMVCLYFVDLEIDWDMLCDGDDGLIFLEEEDLPKMEFFVTFCEELGFKMELEAPVRRLEDIEFCQCHPVEVVPNKYVMVRKPARAISRAAMSNCSMATRIEALQTLWAVGSCELALGTGIPVMQEFALWALRNGRKASARRLAQVQYRLSYRYWDLPKSNTPLPVSAVARASFAEAFGISPGEQLILERAFRNHNFDLADIRYANEPHDAGAGPVYVGDSLVYNRCTYTATTVARGTQQANIKAV